MSSLYRSVSNTRRSKGRLFLLPMNNFVFHGEVKQGRIKFDHPEKYLVNLSTLEGKRIELTIQKERHNRSLSQNSYYWGVVIEILGNNYGYDPEEMHEALKFKFLKLHEDSGLVTTRSTRKLTTVEFGDYLDKVIRWAAEEGLYIPPAGEFV